MCHCMKTAISYTDARGNARTAPVSYACAMHGETARATRRAVQDIANGLIRDAQRLIRALPAPRVLLGPPDINSDFLEMLSRKDLRSPLVTS